MEFCFGQIIHLYLSHLVLICLPFSPQESERTTVRERLRVGRNLRERGVFRRRERGGLVERRLS
ncbi:hypothetical protein HID58_093898, partial [Brassica napus]